MLLAVALSNPLTFSITTILGFRVSIASAKCDQRPDRVPSFSPARLPASETSWHGNPPQITSTGSTVFQSTMVTSPKLGTLGNRVSRIFDGALSNSQCQTTSPPMAFMMPSSRPPYPLNNDPIFIFASRR
jgi:hypothetical protein